MTMDAADKRMNVCRIARTWLGTPYHHQAAVKGAGVDCAMFIKAVFEEAALIPKTPMPDYSPQWHLHHSTELLVKRLLRHAVEIDQATALPGDIVALKFGQTHSHCAIVLETGWPLIAHADYESRVVVLGLGTEPRFTGDRLPRFFTLARW